MRARVFVVEESWWWGVVFVVVAGRGQSGDDAAVGSVEVVAPLMVKVRFPLSLFQLFSLS